MEQPKRILIVEDDANLQLALSDRLKSEGYEVFTASDGVGAMSQAIKHQPDLILLDLMMPAGNGFSTLERVRSHSTLRTTRVVMMTARQKEGLSKRAIEEYGADAFLEKPIETTELLEVIGELA